MLMNITSNHITNVLNTQNSQLLSEKNSLTNLNKHKTITKTCVVKPVTVNVFNTVTKTFINNLNKTITNYFKPSKTCLNSSPTVTQTVNNTFTQSVNQKCVSTKPNILKTTPLQIHTHTKIFVDNINSTLTKYKSVNVTCNKKPTVYKNEMLTNNLLFTKQVKNIVTTKCKQQFKQTQTYNNTGFLNKINFIKNIQNSTNFNKCINQTYNNNSSNIYKMLKIVNNL